MSVPRDDSLNARWKKLRQYWGLLIVLLGVLASGVNGYLLKQIAASSVMTVWQTMYVTLPLTVGVAIIVYLWVADVTTNLGTYGVVLIGTAFATTLLGLPGGNLTPMEADNSGWWSTLIGLMSAYWNAYGAGGFLSAVAVGWFLGWGTHLMLKGGKSAASDATDAAPPAT